MKILLVTQWFDPEPTFKGLLFAQELVRAGNEVEVIEGNDPMTNTGQYNQDVFTREALDFVKRRAGEDQPFFLYLSYAVPHLAVTVPEESKDQYRDLGWPERKMDTEGHYKNDADGNLFPEGFGMMEIHGLDSEMIDVAASFDTWHRLREYQGLSLEESSQRVVNLLRCIVDYETTQ